MDFIVKETAGDRIVLIPRPLTLPGVCAICGFSGTNEGNAGDIRIFIDFQLDIDYYGRVYWCSSCLLQAANSLGWMGVEQVEELLNKVASLESELIVLREQNERLRASLSSLLGSDNASHGNVLSDDNQDERRSEGDSEGAITSEQSSQSSFDELISEQESTGISVDSGGFDTSGQFKL